MKKIIPLLMIMIFACGGCSYLSYLNPWHEEEKVEAVPESAANQFLWKASLKKLGFMPIVLQNEKEGIIKTDWYAENSQSKEEFQLTVKVISRELRSDGVVVEGKSRKKVGGKWQEQPISAQTKQVIELAILDEARKLYQQSFNQ